MPRLERHRALRNVGDCKFSDPLFRSSSSLGRHVPGHARLTHRLDSHHLARGDNAAAQKCAEEAMALEEKEWIRELFSHDHHLVWRFSDRPKALRGELLLIQNPSHGAEAE